MKKILTAVIAAFMACTACFAADLRFAPDENGYFIYCNNNELIRRSDLSDSSNENPTYIMNNINMTSGKYTLYFSHINRTEKTEKTPFEDSADAEKMNYSEDEKKAQDEIVENGFDIEVDVLFRAETNTKIRLTALGFEVQKARDYYNMSSLVRYEDSWGCLNAVASYFGRPLIGAYSADVFNPQPAAEKEIEIKAGECVWLSDYIDNYSVVPWLKPVHLLADFEIVYGCTDINIAALKSTGTLRDRSKHVLNAAHGKYFRDRQYKGRASSLPSVTAPLSFTVDDSVKNGEKLSVTVYNSFVPNGNTVSEWLTHINPQSDYNARRIAAGSDILPLEYFDPSKKDYYSSSFPNESRSNCWVFNNERSDTKRYEKYSSMESEENFEPNYVLNDMQDNRKVSGNFANYCVRTNYDLTVENKCSRKRFICYNAKTSARLIVSLKDENGNYIENSSFVKAYSKEGSEETLAVYELPPQSVSRFTIEVFLPINYVGGIRNSLFVSDEKPEITHKESTLQRDAVNEHFTGKDFIKWQSGALWRSDNGADWEKAEKSDEIFAAFCENSETYRFKYVGGCYAALPYTYAQTSAYYTPYLKYKTDVYFLDEELKTVKTAHFDEYPTEVSYAGGRWFVKAGKKYVSSNLEDWEEAENADLGLPIDNGSGKILAPRNDGETFLSIDGGKTFYRIDFRPDVRKPFYLNVAGDIYYYVENKYINVSYDGVEWARIGEAKERITDIYRLGNEFIANGSEHFEIPSIPNYTNVILGGEVMQYDKQVKNHSYGVLVPLEMSAQKIGAEYSYDGQSGKVTVNYRGKELNMKVGSNEMTVNKKRRTLPSNVVYAHSRVFVPAEMFEELGFKAEYFENARVELISGNEADTPKTDSEETEQSSGESK